MAKRNRHNKRNNEQWSIYGDLPRLARHIETAAFGHWIMDRGGECIHTTNPYEVARWRSWETHDVAVLYKKADGTLTWTLSSADDYRAFLRDEA